VLLQFKKAANEEAEQRLRAREAEKRKHEALAAKRQAECLLEESQKKHKEKQLQYYACA
jgi:hypothetical protein